MSNFARFIPKHLARLIKSSKSPLAIFSLWFCSNDSRTTLKGFRISSLEDKSYFLSNGFFATKCLSINLCVLLISSLKGLK